MQTAFMYHIWSVKSLGRQHWSVAHPFSPPNVSPPCSLVVRIYSLTCVTRHTVLCTWGKGTGWTRFLTPWASLKSIWFAFHFNMIQAAHMVLSKHTSVYQFRGAIFWVVWSCLPTFVSSISTMALSERYKHLYTSHVVYFNTWRTKLHCCSSCIISEHILV